MENISTVNGLVVTPVGERGPNGDHHRYAITGFDTRHNPSRQINGVWARPKTELQVLFQNGPLRDGQWSGITLESLLDIAIHRLEGCQTGPYASHYNQVALNALTQASVALNEGAKQRKSVAGGLRSSTNYNPSAFEQVDVGNDDGWLLRPVDPQMPNYTQCLYLLRQRIEVDPQFADLVDTVPYKSAVMALRHRPLGTTPYEAINKLVKLQAHLHDLIHAYITERQITHFTTTPSM